MRKFMDIFFDKKLFENDTTAVYKGWSVKEHKQVIIKIIKPGTFELELRNRFIGRKNEIRTLKNAYKKTYRGNGEIVLVSGYAGTGKTKLIKEFLKSITLRKGFYTYGKFDEVQREVPYVPYVNAFNILIKQLMTESKNELESWKREIKKILGNNGAVIRELIPNIELIIGKQAHGSTLQPKEAINLFPMVFGDFLRIFQSKKVPLILFLDDVQWADKASLKLLKYLCKNTCLDYLLIICAYRDNEIDESHPFGSFIKEIRDDEDIAVREIQLKHFSIEEVREFLAATLHPSIDSTDELAEILYHKTCGNPFYLIQILMQLYRNQIVRFNMEQGCWEWELEPIKELSTPENILDFLITKLRQLPKKTLDILKLASCNGNRFDLKTLSKLSNLKAVEVNSILMPALEEGLTIRSSQSNLDLLDKDVDAEVYFEFFHDKVRDAVYNLLPEKEKKEIHIKIGRLILQNAKSKESKDKVVVAVDHMNRGMDLIDDLSERLKLSEYNLEAGRRAKSTAAFDEANNYFKSGIKFLPQDPWDSNYQLWFNLCIEHAQCEYLLGNECEAEKIFKIIISHTKTVLELADVYGLQMVLYSGKGNYAEAVKIGINALLKIGFRMTERPHIIDIIKELLWYKYNMLKKRPEDLLKLPDMKDPIHRKVSQLLIKFILATCTDYHELYLYAIIKAGNHALKQGNTEMSSIGYLGFSIIEGCIFGNYKTGYELGKVALMLADKYDKSFSKSIANFTFGAIIVHWTNHAKEGLKYLKKAVEYSSKAGDVLIAGFSLGVILENKYLIGVHLEEIICDAQNCICYAKKINHENLSLNAEIYERIASALANKTNVFFATGNKNFVEKDLIKYVTKDKSSLAAYHFSQIQLYYLAEDYKAAFLEYEKVQNCMGAIRGFLLYTECNFYGTLAITAIFDKVCPKEKKKLFRILKKNKNQMKKWSDSCSANFLHKYLLVDAEMMRILGENQKACVLYDKAIQSAEESGYIHNAAIASELAAKFYLEKGRDEIAKSYINNALHFYQKWGAIAKVKSLKKKYIKFFGNEELKNAQEKNVMADGLIEAIQNFYDYKKNAEEIVPNLKLVLKSINSFFEQSEPDKLFEVFLVLVMELTCASKGYLIMGRDNELYIEAYKNARTDNNIVTKSVPFERSQDLSKRIVRYVNNTLEPAIINCRDQPDIFIKDPYIAKSRAKSIACIPLKFKGIGMGVLYIENEFSPEFYTKEQLELLEMISEQMLLAKLTQAFTEQDYAAHRYDSNCDSIELLSDREIEVLKLVAEGMTNQEIAEKLVISHNTVKTHMKNIYSKFKVSRRVQLVEKAKEYNII